MNWIKKLLARINAGDVVPKRKSYVNEVYDASFEWGLFIAPYRDHSNPMLMHGVPVHQHEVEPTGQWKIVKHALTKQTQLYLEVIDDKNRLEPTSWVGSGSLKVMAKPKTFINNCNKGK